MVGGGKWVRPEAPSRGASGFGVRPLRGVRLLSGSGPLRGVGPPQGQWVCPSGPFRGVRLLLIRRAVPPATGSLRGSYGF